MDTHVTWHILNVFIVRKCDKMTADVCACVCVFLFLLGWVCNGCMYVSLCVCVVIVPLLLWGCLFVLCVCMERLQGRTVSCMFRIIRPPVQV